jgi:hypothetical protein
MMILGLYHTHRTRLDCPRMRHMCGNHGLLEPQLLFCPTEKVDSSCLSIVAVNAKVEGSGSDSGSKLDLDGTKELMRGSNCTEFEDFHLLMVSSDHQK